MIGTRRTTVNAILGTMERKGLLRHQRGRITISDHKHLEKAACDCYPLLRRSLDRLYKAGRHCVQIASPWSITQVTDRNHRSKSDSATASPSLLHPLLQRGALPLHL